VLSDADLRLDLRGRTAFLGDREVALTHREFALVETFMRHRGEALSRDERPPGCWTAVHGRDPIAATDPHLRLSSSLRRSVN
jgi:DNA-binding response OmpR family regulator